MIIHLSESRMVADRSEIYSFWTQLDFLIRGTSQFTESELNTLSITTDSIMVIPSGREETNVVCDTSEDNMVVFEFKLRS